MESGQGASVRNGEAQPAATRTKVQGWSKTVGPREPWLRTETHGRMRKRFWAQNLLSVEECPLTYQMRNPHEYVVI